MPESLGLFVCVRVRCLRGVVGRRVGHFFFQENKPASFIYPTFSFMGDIKMWALTVTGSKPW